MERKGFIKPVQGGGSGKGYEHPSSLLFDESELFMERSGAAIARARQEEKNSEDPAEIERQSSWATELSRRLYRLSKIRELNYKSASNLGQESNEVRKFLRNKGSASSTLREIEKSSSPSRSAENLRLTVSEQGAGTKGETKKSVCATSMVQVIPGIPKEIGEAVSLWRFGSEVSNSHPLKLYTKAEFRKRSIGKTYSDVSWKKSGQKAALKRIEKLIVEVARCGDPPLESVYDSDVDDCKWQEAVNNFKEKWSGKSLSSVIVQSSKSISQ